MEILFTNMTRATTLEAWCKHVWPAKHAAMEVVREAQMEILIRALH